MCSVFPQAGMPRHGVRFHDAPGGGAVDMEGAAEAAKVAPELNLSTLEYYLFTFAWVRKRKKEGGGGGIRC